MPYSMSQAALPALQMGLDALSAILDKAEAYAAAKKIDPKVLLDTRLAPDMFSLSTQVQVATDLAKNGAARLSGAEPPRYEDTEKTIDELKARIAKTIAFVNGVKPDQLANSAARDVTLPLRGNSVTFKGEWYLKHFVMPNFYFHITTAYDILRHNGVELSKGDFIGTMS
jgi:hypothetical protein